MKLECSIEKLKNAVNQVSKASSKNISLDVLNNIVLETKDKSLLFSSSNLNIGLEIEIPVSVEEKGKIGVNGQNFENIINNLDIKEKIVNLKTEGDSLVLNNKNNLLKLKTNPTEDFPGIPKIKGDSFNIKIKDLLHGLRSVYYASAVSDIKPEISSVYIYSNDDYLYFVSTDSFRLAERKIKNTGINIDKILIPYKNVIDIIKIISLMDENDDLEVVYNDNQISLTKTGFYLTSRLIDGSFPDYSQIIPDEYKTKVVCLKSDIQKALKISSIFSDKFNQINILIDPKSKLFEIDSENKDIGQNKINIPGAIEGDKVEFSVNLKYLNDSFQSLNEDSIVFEILESNKPIIIKANGDKNFLYLIMPMNR